jgi:hypothetical protein
MYPYNDKTIMLDEQQIKDFKKNIIPEVYDIIKKSIFNNLVVENAKNVLDSFFNEKDNTVKNYSNGQYYLESKFIKSLCHQPDDTLMILAN